MDLNLLIIEAIAEITYGYYTNSFANIAQVDDRLQQPLKSDKLFGGIRIALYGDLPYSIILQFHDYQGPPFFSGIRFKQYNNNSADPLVVDWVLTSPPDMMDKRVPIIASEFKWG